MAFAQIQVDGVEVSPQHYIDGARVASLRSFEVFSPIQQQRLGEVCEADDEQIARAIDAAQRAFPGWAALSAARRKPYLDRFAQE
ncbi:MAG: aldehyde dehydrogenase family protein, partial [Betaproteobacteria bacterium]